MTSFLSTTLVAFLLASNTLVFAASSDFQYPYTSSQSFSETLVANSTCLGVYEGANTAFACECITDEATSAFSVCAPATPDLITAFCSGGTVKESCYTAACPSGPCAPLPIVGSTVFQTDCATGTALGYTQTGKCGCFATSNSTTAFTGCTDSSTSESAVCISESLTASDGVEGGYSAFCDTRSIVTEVASLAVSSTSPSTNTATATDTTVTTSAIGAVPTVFTVVDGTLALVTGDAVSTGSDSATATSSVIDTDAVMSAIATQAVPSTYTVINGTLAIPAAALVTSTSSTATAVRTDITAIGSRTPLARSSSHHISRKPVTPSPYHNSRKPTAVSASRHLSRKPVAVSSHHISRTPLSVPTSASHSSSYTNSRHPTLVRSTKTRSPTAAVRTAYPLSIIQDPTGTQSTESSPTAANTPNITVVTATRTKTILSLVTSTDAAEVKTLTAYKLSPSQCIKYTYIFPEACCPTAALGLTKRATHARRFGSVAGHGKINVVVTEYIPTEVTEASTTTVPGTTTTATSYLRPQPSGCLSSTVLDLKRCPSKSAQANAVADIKRHKKLSKNKVMIDCGDGGKYEY